MEKTMRWWSDCTANWREKWSKVRNERNKAIEETKALKAKLEEALKDTNTIKRDKNELEQQINLLKKELESMQIGGTKTGNKYDNHLLDALESDLICDLAQSNARPNISQLEFEMINNDNGHENNVELNGSSAGPSVMNFKNKNCRSKNQTDEYILQSGLTKHGVELFKDGAHSEISEKMDSMEKKMNFLKTQLEDALTKLDTEKEEKFTLQETIATLTQEVSELRSQCEHLTSDKMSLERDSVGFKEQLRILKAALTDETSIKEALTRRQLHLRNELDRIHSEHDIEWWRRERCETQKNALERENGSLRAELEELQSVLAIRDHGGAKYKNLQAKDQEILDLRKELAQKTKELADLKHMHGKLKNCYHDTLTSVSQAQSRSDQYENEIKKLRGRIDELKQELYNAEREVESATNNIRRLHRTNEELQAQIGVFQTQMDQLHNRLQSCDSPSLLSIRGPPEEASESETD
ncbi:coiled-coil domain-containing protein 102A isoform X2 [Ctenocephalides felis]|nr:coiled-coil domain-containing protein 102A isoform X2 [Ctenocephalides felis]